jgi:hypothetical protein
MKNISKRKFLVILSASVIFGVCSSSVNNVKISSSGKQPELKDWVNQGVMQSGNSFSFDKKDARLSTKAGLQNFTLNLHVKTTAGAEGMILFHAPDDGKIITKGYQVIINNSDYRAGNPQKTGSLAFIRNNFVRNTADDQWFDMQISVKANHISVKVNDKLISDYIEPDKPQRIVGNEGMILSSGRVIIKKSSAAGSILIDKISISSLPDLPRETPDPLTIDSVGEALTRLNQMGFPLIDFHGHLKGGLTADQVSEHGRKYGYNYGISPNCGLNFPVTNDSSLIAYYNNLAPEPVFKAMQCEGREWITLFSPAAISKFDYIFTDAMTWTDNKGRRMRLWIPAETFVDDEQQFMEMLVGKIEAILNNEPVDIHVNPTYLPGVIAADYDKLWTPERMDRVINALKNNDVALEINARFKIPSLAFIKRARSAGVKFSLGTNNADNTDLNRLEYCIKIIKEAGITPQDIFLPRPSGDKKVMKKGLPAKITG